MVQISPCKGPLRMRSKLPGYTASSLRASSRPAWEKAVSCYKVDPLVAKFPQRSVIACSMQISCCRERMLQTRPWRGVCETLMPDVVAPKAQSQLHVHVSSADLPLDSIHKNLGWWVVTQRTLKNHKTVKIGGWALARDNMVVHKTITTIIL